MQDLKGRTGSKRRNADREQHPIGGSEFERSRGTATRNSCSGAMSSRNNPAMVLIYSVQTIQEPPRNV
jgi:hypothetical protein